MDLPGSWKEAAASSFTQSKEYYGYAERQKFK